MTRRAQVLPRVEVRIASGDQNIGFCQEGVALPAVRELIRTALFDSAQGEDDTAWGPFIEVYQGERKTLYPTLQCIRELGLVGGRIRVTPIEWSEF